MCGELVEWNGVGHSACLDTVKEHLTNSRVQGTGYEVIGLVGAYLLAGLAEVSVVEIIDHCLRPPVRGHFFVEQLRAPPAKIQRSAADTIGQPRKLGGRVPRKSPYFLSRFIEAKLALI